MVMGVLEGGFLIYNSLQDRFEGIEAKAKAKAKAAIPSDKKPSLT